MESSAGSEFDRVFELNTAAAKTTTSVPNGAMYAFTRCLASGDVISLREGATEWPVYAAGLTSCGDVTSEAMTLRCRLVADIWCHEMLVVSAQLKLRDVGMKLGFTRDGDPVGSYDVIGGCVLLLVKLENRRLLILV